MNKILLLEDEIKTVTTIAKGLRENGYEVEYARNGDEGYKMVQKNAYDLIITDILMPEMNGLEFCKMVRAQNSAVPILILSALSLTEDKLKGFESGSDDYLVKPFDFLELLARIRAILKRTSEVKLPQHVIQYADLSLNVDTKEVSRKDKQIQLTAQEFKLLHYFMQHKETLLTKEQIVENVWKLDFDTGTNIVEVYISYLRNKIHKDFESNLIHTRKGLGYILKEIVS